MVSYHDKKDRRSNFPRINSTMSSISSFPIWEARSTTSFLSSPSKIFFNTGLVRIAKPDFGRYTSQSMNFLRAWFTRVFVLTSCDFDRSRKRFIVQSSSLNVMVEVFFDLLTSFIIWLFSVQSIYEMTNLVN